MHFTVKPTQRHRTPTKKFRMHPDIPAANSPHNSPDPSHLYPPKQPLSLVAIGLLTWLQQWPEGWHIHADELVQHFPEARAYIKPLLRHLCSMGAITHIHNGSHNIHNNHSYRNHPQHIDILRDMAPSANIQTMSSTLSPAQKRVINHVVKNTLALRPLLITPIKLQVILEACLLDPEILPHTGNHFLNKLTLLRRGLCEENWTPAAAPLPIRHTD